jgi:hypothetical protein
MTSRGIHADDLLLKFGTYCQVSKHVEPRNSLAERKRGAISIGNSGNLTGGQAFMALDTGAKITRFQWTELPMPKAVIERVNQIGKDKPSILTFTNRHGDEIGDTTQDFDSIDDNDEITGVEQINEVPTETTNEPTGVDFDPEPTGVEVETNHDDIYDPVPQGQDDNGLGQQVRTSELPNEPAEPSPTRRSSRLTKQWKQL